MNELSTKRLLTCHTDLQRLFVEVDKYYSVIVLEGHRGQKDQNKAFADGKSKLQWPLGKHNSFPSNAIDVAPSPLDWGDKYRFYYFSGIVMNIADQMKIKIRWGGNWKMDGKLKENKFNDLVHFELVGENEKIKTD